MYIWSLFAYKITGIYTYILIQGEKCGVNEQQTAMIGEQCQTNVNIYMLSWIPRGEINLCQCTF